MSKPVRLPDYLHAEVERLAAAEKRSTANMVQVLLEQALQLPEHFNQPKAGPATSEPRVEIPMNMGDGLTHLPAESRPTPGMCGMSNRHRMRTKQNPCPRCGYPT